MSEPIVYEITEAGSDAMRYVAARNPAGATVRVAARTHERALRSLGHRFYTASPMTPAEIRGATLEKLPFEDATAKPQADLPTRD